MADNPPPDPAPELPVARGDGSAPAPLLTAAADAPLVPPTLPAPRSSRRPSREFLLITAGVIVGLVLGIYRTKIRDSVGVLEELWTLASPVVATVASTVLGSVFQEHGFKGALAKRLGSVLILSLLLTLSAEGFLRAAKDLAVGRRAAPATTQSVTAPVAPPTAPTEPAARQSTEENRVKVPAGRAAAPPVSSASTPPTSSAGAPPASRASAAPSSAATLARCSELNARGSIGETLTAEERDFLARNCRK